MKRLSVVLLGVLVGPGWGWSGAAWADWPSVRGDAALTGHSSTTIAASPVVRWTFEAGGAIAGVAMAQGVVVASDGSGILHAIDLEKGTSRWRYEAGAEIEAPPTIDRGLVYVGDMNGVVHAVSLDKGTRVWTFATDGEIHAGVTVAGDCLLIGSYDASVRCLSREGKERWKVETDNYVHSAVAVADGTVWIAGCDGFLRGIALDSGRELHRIELGGYVAASPAIARGSAVVGNFENEVVGLDLAKATVRWRWSDPDRSFPFASSPATDGTTAWIGGRDRRVHAFDLASGSPKWSWNAGSKVDASPLLAGKHLVIGTERGQLVVLDAATGRELSKLDLGSGLSSPAAAFGLILVGSADGLLYALGAPEEG